MASKGPTDKIHLRLQGGGVPTSVCGLISYTLPSTFNRDRVTCQQCIDKANK